MLFLLVMGSLISKWPLMKEFAVAALLAAKTGLCWPNVSVMDISSLAKLTSATALWISGSVIKGPGRISGSGVQILKQKLS